MVVLQVMLGLTFLTVALAKLKITPNFVGAVQQYSFGLFKPGHARIIARLLPLCEFLLGFLLITGIWLKVAAFLVTGLLLTFTIPMIIHLVLGNRFACNCFGSASSKIGVGSLTRNTILIAASLVLAVVSPWAEAGVKPFFTLSLIDIIALLTSVISVYTLLLVINEIDAILHILRMGSRS